ncbi:hypothetical protein Nmel_015106, partial [Mimus melanotis]
MSLFLSFHFQITECRIRNLPFKCKFATPCTQAQVKNGAADLCQRWQHVALSPIFQ